MSLHINHILTCLNIFSFVSKAFYNCKMLSQINIPATVVKIGGSAFYDSGLETIIFEAGSMLNMIGDRVSELRII